MHLQQIFSEEKLPDSYRYQVMKMNVKEDEVPEGKFNSTRAEHFLAANERDSSIYSAEVLADVYKIDKKAMGKNIIFANLNFKEIPFVDFIEIACCISQT